MYKIYIKFRRWLRAMQQPDPGVPDDPLSKMSLQELADLPPWHERATASRPCNC